MDVHSNHNESRGWSESLFFVGIYPVFQASPWRGYLGCPRHAAGGTWRNPWCTNTVWHVPQTSWNLCDWRNWMVRHELDCWFHMGLGGVSFVTLVIEPRLSNVCHADVTVLASVDLRNIISAHSSTRKENDVTWTARSRFDLQPPKVQILWLLWRLVD